jgi:hypothetical protein
MVNERKSFAYSPARCKEKINFVRCNLCQIGLRVVDERPNNNQTGTRLTFNNGAIVEVFRTGTILVQGKNTDAIEMLFMDKKVPFSSSRGRFDNFEDEQHKEATLHKYWDTMNKNVLKINERSGN